MKWEKRNAHLYPPLWRYHLLRNPRIPTKTTYSLQPANPHERATQKSTTTIAPFFQLTYITIVLSPFTRTIYTMNASTVCVTGANGFVGSWLVMRLLQRGYTVRATLRDPENIEKVKHLLELQRGEGQLSLWKADLCVDGSFDAVVSGCDGVFHVASPVYFHPKDPQNEIIKPTVDGVVGIMKACVKSGSVKRFIYTSSAGAVSVGEKKASVYTEDSWSDVEFCNRKKMFGWMYFVAKTVAEKTAEEYAVENNMSYVSIVPTLVVGPFISPSMPLSLTTALSPLTGTVSHYSILKQCQFVHLDDLCNAYIFLYESPHSKGRYICSSHDATIFEVAEIIKEMFPQYDIPTKFIDIHDDLERISFSSNKLKSMGFEYKHTLEEMYEDAIKTCQNKGFLSFENNDFSNEHEMHSNGDEEVDGSHIAK